MQINVKVPKRKLSQKAHKNRFILSPENENVIYQLRLFLKSLEYDDGFRKKIYLIRKKYNFNDKEFIAFEFDEKKLMRSLFSKIGEQNYWKLSTECMNLAEEIFQNRFFTESIICFITSNFFPIQGTGKTALMNIEQVNQQIHNNGLFLYIGNNIESKEELISDIDILFPHIKSKSKKLLSINKKKDHGSLESDFLIYEERLKRTPYKEIHKILKEKMDVHIEPNSIMKRMELISKKVRRLRKEGMKNISVTNLHIR